MQHLTDLMFAHASGSLLSQDFLYISEDGSRRGHLMRTRKVTLAGDADKWVWSGTYHAGITSRALTQDELDVMIARLVLEGHAA